MKKLISNFVLISGFILLGVGGYLFYLRYSAHPLTFEAKPTAIVVSGKEKPIRIEIPNIKVNLPIVPAISKGSKWESTNIGVSYLSTSPIPGSRGNSIMYGHNWTSLLSNLPKVKPGQAIIVTMNNGKKRVFTVEYTAIVNPSQTYIIESTQDTRITLYTCAGFLDSKRFVVVAKPLI